MIETAGLKADGKEPSKYLGYGVIRPRSVILENKGNPGSPDRNPLLVSEPETSSPPPAQESQEDVDSSADKAAVVGEGDEGVSVGMVVGGVAVAAILGVGVFAFARMRRK
jgi:hypothetical protein